MAAVTRDAGGWGNGEGIEEKRKEEREEKREGEGREGGKKTQSSDNRVVVTSRKGVAG